MPKKRILHIVGSLNAGGMETMILNYYKHIDREKIQFDFLIFTKEKNFYEDIVKKMGANVYKIIPRRKNWIKNWRELKEFFKTHSYEIVHIHQGITTLLPLKMASRFHVKKIIVHNHGINRKILKILKIYDELYVKKVISKRATDYFSCSEKVLSQLYDKKIINNNHFFICRNAIELEKFLYNEEQRNRIRKQLKVQDKFVIGHVGTFTKPKNHKFLLSIFTEIQDQRKDAILLLIGKGPLEKKIRKLAMRLGIEEKVLFLGQVSNVNEIMQAMDYFIFPSIYEGLPITLIEAQASGLRILTSDCITKETELTDKIIYQSLKNSPKEWAKEVLKAKANNRKVLIEQFNDYNIEVATRRLEKEYLK